MSVASKVDAVHRALVVFADDVHAKLGLAGSPKVWPEDQLKSPVSVLFQALAVVPSDVVHAAASAVTGALWPREPWGRWVL